VLIIVTRANPPRLFGARTRPTHPVQVGIPVVDTKSIWDGVYTEDQAKRGRVTYVERCGYCHRDDLTGNGGDEPGASPPPLKGMPFLNHWRSSTLADLFALVFSTMPKDRPKLDAQAYIDIVSFILQVNGAKAGDSELTAESDKLKDIVISEKDMANLLMVKMLRRPGARHA
jgi:cytochrome c